METQIIVSGHIAELGVVPLAWFIFTGILANVIWCCWAARLVWRDIFQPIPTTTNTGEDDGR